MGIDPAKEDCFSLSDGPRKVKKTYHQLYAWITTGVAHTKIGEAPGPPIKLESIRLPTLGTSIEAYHRFLRRINGID
jgi:hypothetical protein